MNEPERGGREKETNTETARGGGREGGIVGGIEGEWEGDRPGVHPYPNLHVLGAAAPAIAAAPATVAAATALARRAETSFAVPVTIGGASAHALLLPRKPARLSPPPGPASPVLLGLAGVATATAAVRETLAGAGQQDWSGGWWRGGG